MWDLAIELCTLPMKDSQSLFRTQPALYMFRRNQVNQMARIVLIQLDVISKRWHVDASKLA